AGPQGAVPLGPLIKAPAALAARLAFTALVERKDGERLRKALPPGARLVSREGDLWRWDGFTARADAPRAAAVRMEQKTRLSEIEEEIERLRPLTSDAKAGLTGAAERLRAAEETVRAARQGPRDAEAGAAQAREAVERLQREGARRDARAQSLDETIARFEAERAEAEAALATA